MAFGTNQHWLAEENLYGLKNNVKSAFERGMEHHV
jgi:hypothetical protein